MSRQTLNLSPELYDYLLAVSDREPALLARLREETAQLPSANMQIAPDQGQFMAMLAKLTGTRKALEIGTYTGYSALAVALTLPPDGKMICCDLSREWTDMARRYWREAGVADKIDLHLRPAADTLKDLLDKGEQSSFDFVFIDADKENYDDYYESALHLIRPGGLILVDNVLWNGAVIDPDKTDPDTLAIRQFNAERTRDDRIDLCMVPVGDGLTLARKR